MSPGLLRGVLGHEYEEIAVMKRALCLLLPWLAIAQVQAQEVLRDKAEVEALLAGATMHGVYLRNGSAYTLKFGEDGVFADEKNAGARWWVTEQGQYCREWLNGPLAGNEACMDVALDGERVLLFSNGSRVAEGELQR